MGKYQSMISGFSWFSWFDLPKIHLYHCYDSVPDNRFVMSNLPVPVAEEEVEEMMRAADTNKDGAIGYEEFRVMLHR